MRALMDVNAWWVPWTLPAAGVVVVVWLMRRAKAIEARRAIETRRSLDAMRRARLTRLAAERARMRRCPRRPTGVS